MAEMWLVKGGYVAASTVAEMKVVKYIYPPRDGITVRVASGLARIEYGYDPEQPDTPDPLLQSFFDLILEILQGAGISGAIPAVPPNLPPAPVPGG